MNCLLGDAEERNQSYKCDGERPEFVTQEPMRQRLAQAANNYLA